jgi:hypothetical protein
MSLGRATLRCSTSRAKQDKAMGPTRPLHGHYEAEDLVSVWIGTFPNETAFTEYLKEDYLAKDDDDFPRCRFWQVLGIRWHDHDFQEAIFRSDPVPVADLITDISWVASYKTDLLKRCSELGIAKANCAIVICEYDYPPAAGFTSRYLTFVGSFRYSTGGRPFRRSAS